MDEPGRTLNGYRTGDEVAVTATSHRLSAVLPAGYGPTRLRSRTLTESVQSTDGSVQR
jgi:hypothetical protein